MPYIVALTGGICSGKTTIAKKFSDLSEGKISIIDADTISRRITQPGSSAFFMIKKYFGTKIILPNGSINRSSLKKRIFSNYKDKKWLEQLLHPIIRKETKKKINLLSNKSSYILWVVPLLVENNLQKNANRILVVDTYPKIQFNRIINRDKINKKEAMHILSSQASRQHRLSFADDVIYNNKGIHEIKQYISILHQFYLKMKNKNTKNTIFNQ